MYNFSVCSSRFKPKLLTASLGMLISLRLLFIVSKPPSYIPLSRLSRRSMVSYMVLIMNTEGTFRFLTWVVSIIFRLSRKMISSTLPVSSPITNNCLVSWSYPKLLIWKLFVMMESDTRLSKLSVMSESLSSKLVLICCRVTKSTSLRKSPNLISWILDLAQSTKMYGFQLTPLCSLLFVSM